MTRLCLFIATFSSSAVMWLVAAAVVAVAAADRGAAPRCAHPACTLVGGTASLGEMHFTVEGDRMIIDYLEREYFSVQCGGRTLLESDALPSFPRLLSVEAVTARACPPGPRALRASLAALNVSLAVGGRLALLQLPAVPPLSAAHLAGLDRLASLHLSAQGAPPAPAPGFLRPLRHLQDLRMQNVRLPPDDLTDPPPTLRRLELRHAGVRSPPALRGIARLTLEEPELDAFDPPPGLTNLTLSSRATALRVVDVPSLESLELTNWTVPKRHPVPLQRCGALRSLRLTGPDLETLPEGWLSACPALRVLVIRRARALTHLPALLLENATALEHLEVSGTAVEYLPEELLHGAPNLITLNLSSNRLHALASAQFTLANKLKQLNLSSNLLRSVYELRPLHALLEELSLAANPLPDLCTDNNYDYSPLRYFKKLTSLSLNRTNITRICPDWRQDLRLLNNLDLSNTHVSTLWAEDLTFRRDDSADELRVLLYGAPVHAVRFPRPAPTGYSGQLGARASVYIDSELDCDCQMYWARLALSAPGAAARVHGLICRGGRPLLRVPPDDMLCAAPQECRRAALPAACACRARDDDGSAAPGATQLVEVRCERANLTSVPLLPASPGTAYDLLLPHNRIANLSAGDLPPLLRELDLRNNSLERVGGAAAAELAGAPARLRLALNRLECGCEAEPLLRALAARLAAGRTTQVDACPDGRALAAVAAEAAPCARVPLAAWLAAALAALLVAAAGVLAWLAPPERRLLVKALLYRWGMLRRAPEPDGEFLFDAFVSFAHEDEEAVRELAARLEGGPAPRRLCLHYRDWAPGLRIPDHIEESVARSHRTVALVSRHYLASRWARAEFRSAQALALRSARPRLVVVLLEPAEALPLDAELRSYLAANTYVRWGDPWFWDKLQLALPPPRRRDKPKLDIKAKLEKVSALK